MKVLIIFAHPEPQSLNGALHRIAVQELEEQGHHVQVSDLYKIKWKSEVDREDFPNFPKEQRLDLWTASADAYAQNSLTPDVLDEQDKLRWADFVIFQFPLWWFTMPAILKGWVDRVYTYGFAHGLGDHTDQRWGDRYGEGTLAGKRAMLIVTLGGWEEHYSARGISGPIEDVLFPINHGVLFYPGFEVLPPFVAFRVHKTSFDEIASTLRKRMREIEFTKSIPYRNQNGGEYSIPTLTLHEKHGGDVSSGFGLHTRMEVEASDVKADTADIMNG
ncbi:unnamed protein product [Penicillium egyptiacum]|uniref:Flavodoxin-like fold domain-containing protein n=1 Tax=Penicillium egyptiacum TaxID=1303716 RepID=A0A9W4KF16_9EURO|nr:unnamed protein product [Penicillium egyptiacum]